MLQLEEETTQKQLKDIDHLDLSLAKIPMKALYKFQFSIAQEIQSRELTDVTELQTTKDIKDTLNITLRKCMLRRIGKEVHWLDRGCIEEQSKAMHKKGHTYR
jgi:hypothetical protein